MGTIRAANECAWSYIGVPYAWGGFGRGGIDCSGLVYMCYYGDLDVMRGDTDALAVDSHFDTCSRADIKPGGIILEQGNDPNHRWQHVGYYVANNTVIHAPTFGQPVRADTLDAFLCWCGGAKMYRNFNADEEENDMKPSDELTSKRYPDGSCENVANSLLLSARNSFRILDGLDRLNTEWARDKADGDTPTWGELGEGTGESYLNNWNALRFAYKNTAVLRVQIEALTAAVESLAQAMGADPDAIAEQVGEAVKAKLERMTIGFEQE